MLSDASPLKRPLVTDQSLIVTVWRVRVVFDRNKCVYENLKLYMHFDRYGEMSGILVNEWKSIKLMFF